LEEKKENKKPKWTYIFLKIVKTFEARISARRKNKNIVTTKNQILLQKQKLKKQTIKPLLKIKKKKKNNKKINEQRYNKMYSNERKEGV